MTELQRVLELVETAYMQLVNTATMCEQLGKCRCNCDSIVLAKNLLLEARKELEELENQEKITPSIPSNHDDDDDYEPACSMEDEKECEEECQGYSDFDECVEDCLAEKGC